MPVIERSARVSAIIPAYNAERWLADAIESVLGQTHPVLECIVVDDGSSDETAAVARRYGERVTLIEQDNAGVSAARNRGAEAATGEMLAFLDADDRWGSTKIAAQVEALTGRPDVEAVVCATQVVDRDLTPIEIVRQDPGLTATELLLCRAEVVSVSSNLLVTREAFAEIGGFDEELSTSADWAVMFRLLERGRLASLPEPLVEYRRHEANMSGNVELFERDMLTAYERVFSGPGAAEDVRRMRRRAYANLRRMIAGSYFVEGRPGPFLRHAVRSVAGHPSTLPYFAGLPVRRWRRSRRRDGSRARVRVLHLITDAGPHPYFRLIGAHADRTRFDVRLATLGPRGALHEEADRMGLASFALGATGRTGYARAGLGLARRLRHDRIEILHVHLLDASVVGLLAARMARTPVAVFTGHHSHEIPLIDRPALTAVDRLCAGPLSDAIIAPSRQMAETLTRFHRVPAGKIEVIEHGFELDRLDPDSIDGSVVREELDLVDRVVLTALGRFYWIKNQQALLRAFAPLARPSPELTLVLAGGGDAHPLRELAGALGIAHQVRVVAPRSDVPEVLAATDLFVHPSLAESFGMVIVEAMAMARPVVSTPVGIAPDVVTEGRTGWLTADGQEASLTAGLRQALAHRTRWPQLGQEARRRASGFRAERMVSRYERLYLGATARSTADG